MHGLVTWTMGSSLRHTQMRSYKGRGTHTYGHTGRSAGRILTKPSDRQLYTHRLNTHGHSRVSHGDTLTDKGEGQQPHFSHWSSAAQGPVCLQLTPIPAAFSGLHRSVPQPGLWSPRASPHLPPRSLSSPGSSTPPHCPARPPRGAHVNDSNKYLIKAPGDAAARQSPLQSGRAG